MTESTTLKRIDLPSGNWWEIETRPKWGEMMKIRKVVVKMTDDGAEGEDFLTEVMAMLTRGWSYQNGEGPLEVSVESINELDLMDAAEIMHEVNEQVIPLFNKVAERGSA
jgi:hypothetical protein